MKATLIPALLTAILASLLTAPCRAESVVVQWEKRYNGLANGQDRVEAVAVDALGNVIVTGFSQTTSNRIDYHTAKYAAADGALLWEKGYDGPFNYEDYAHSVAVDSAGNVIVTGGSTPITTGTRRLDYYTAKYAVADGALLWERRYDGPADGNGDDEAFLVAVDGDDNVIVTGNSSSSGTEDIYDFYTAKYAAANGALLWERRYNGPGNSKDVTVGLAVDGTGNVIVTGYRLTESTSFDFYTAKYAASNGALLWEKYYNGPANDQDFPGGVAVDSGGNVIVTGVSTGTGSSYDCYTAKYAAANGALLWERRYNGPRNYSDSASDVAVDGEDNIIVTGSSTGSGGNSDIYSAVDIYTAKYAAATGALIWEKRYNGPFDGIDFARNVEVDSAGNAVVFGVSATASGTYDFYTAKYAAANGALLWESRQPGPSIGSEYSSLSARLALTPDGGVVFTATSGVRDPVLGSYPFDYYTVKYAPVDRDLDNDGLPDSWEIAHFGDTAAHSALDDTDGDGAVELLELAFGSDPRAANSVPAPAVVIEGGYLTTTITRQPCVRYLVETGATLEAGFSAANTTVLTDTATTLKVRDNVPFGTQAARFLRVQVAAPP